MANPYGDTPAQQREPAKNLYGDLPPPVEHTSTGSQTSETLGGPGWMDTLKTLDMNRALQNTPQSYWNTVEAAAMPVYRPKETIEGLGTMGMMGIENFASQIPGFEDMPTPQKDAFKSYLGERYGSPEALKESIETDPMGMVTDAISVLLGGRGAWRMGVQGGADLLPENLQNDMVKEVAKFPKRNLTNAEVDELVSFMLEENIPFSAKGIERLDDIITTTGSKVDAMIANADQGQLISRDSLNDVLRQMKEDTIGKTSLAAKDVKIIDTVIEGWEQAITDIGKNDFTLAELQQFKKDTYGKIHWADTDSNKKNVRNASLKAQALDAKARIEAEVPGIQEANKRQGMALELKPLAEGTTQRIERNKGNMGQTLSIGSGGGLGYGLDKANQALGFGIPDGTFTALGVGLGGIKGIAGQPKRKMALAQALYNARRADPSLVDEPLAKAMAIYLARENQEQIENR